MITRRYLLQSLIASAFAFLGFQTKELFAWVLVTTYKKEDGTICGPSDTIASVHRTYVWQDGTRCDAKRYVYLVKKHIEDLKGTNQGWHRNGWSIENQEIFPLYR